LLVSPDASLREAVQLAAFSSGYNTVAVRNSLTGMRALPRARFDALCLDSVLPHEDATKVCDAFLSTAEERQAPIIYIGPLSGRLVAATLPASLRDKIAEFVAKPLEPQELAAALDRVTSGARTVVASFLRVRDVTLDGVTRSLSFDDGATVSLTPVEYRLARCLLDQPGDYVSKPDLLERVWGYPPDGGAELVRAHVSNLRRKLRSVGQDARLSTMPYYGYAFLP
jgi:OmpR family response regulator RpaB